jgi:hypothetical protein
MLAAVAACTPQVSLDGRPPPCAPGYQVCDTTGTCVRPEPLSPPGVESAVCPSGFTVRQGASIQIAAPGAAVDDVQILSTGDLVAQVRTVAANGPVVVDVAAPHGTALGDMTRAGAPRLVTISTVYEGMTFQRQIQVVVSPIAASPNGQDSSLGTTRNPFRSITQAASVAHDGDTIVLGLGNNSTPFSEPNEATPVVVPTGVIVQGQSKLMLLQEEQQMPVPEDVDATRAKLAMPVHLEGNATLDNVTLVQRLTLTVPEAHVALTNVSAMGGVAVDSAATQADLSITDGSRIFTNDDTKNPLLVEAANAIVTIARGAHVEYRGPANLAVVLLTGQSQRLTVSDDSWVGNSLFPSAIRVAGGDAHVELNGGSRTVRVLGRLEILGAGSTAEITSTLFNLAQNAGGIVFRGTQMSVSKSDFAYAGIEQDNPSGRVLVRDTTFSKYTTFGYHLLSGQADLGTAAELGHNTFASSQDLWPFTDGNQIALVIDAPVGGSNSVSVSATTFDDISISPCEIMGPQKSGPVSATDPSRIYSIKNMVPIDFY